MQQGGVNPWRGMIWGDTQVWLDKYDHPLWPRT
ncbi:MAG: hypothetical protein M3015_06470 [Bacteroidota bacterium]|nr:hypothetical protein [Bacteroidota bacterium]